MSDDVPSELKPHIVYPAGCDTGSVNMFPNYKAAFDFWELKHDTLKHPYKISVLGRECTVAAPVVDTAE
jgi:hypothetical protein